MKTNDALTDALYAAQSTGLSPEETEQYAQAGIWFSPDATDYEIAALRER
ncbi:hypothetical protein [Microbacterium sp. W4I20]|nr:hypothetical protein [Microbacterium sp. W4I20]